MEAKVTKFIETPSVRYKLQTTIDIPIEVCSIGLVLSSYTSRPCVDIIVEKVIYDKTSGLHLLCKTAKGSNISLEWITDTYGQDWSIDSVFLSHDTLGNKLVSVKD
jgi:hypothetical protein